MVFAMAQPLEQDEIQAALEELPGWRHEHDGLVKTFKFKDFASAIAFVVRVAFECEKADHHPELSNVYNRVTLRFTTHSAGSRVTANDVALARTAERLQGGAGSSRT